MSETHISIQEVSRVRATLSQPLSVDGGSTFYRELHVTFYVLDWRGQEHETRVTAFTRHSRPGEPLALDVAPGLVPSERPHTDEGLTVVRVLESSKGSERPGDPCECANAFPVVHARECWNK